MAALYSSLNRAKMGVVHPKVGVVAKILRASISLAPSNLQYLPMPMIGAKKLNSSGQQNFFTMLMVQVITIPSLKFFQITIWN